MDSSALLEQTEPAENVCDCSSRSGDETGSVSVGSGDETGSVSVGSGDETGSVSVGCGDETASVSEGSGDQSYRYLISSIVIVYDDN